jgi:hypothetical protein
VNTLETLITILGSLAALTISSLTLRPRWQGWRDQQRRHRIGLTYLLEGKPETLDERGKVVPGYPPITVTLDRLSEQLTRNGGASLADTIHRIEEIVQQNRRSIEQQLEDLVRQIVEARHVAGQTAIVAARTEDAHRRDHGQLIQILEEMRDRIWQRFAEQDDRFDEQRIRELTYVAMLHELGIDIDLPDEPPEGEA